MFFIQIFFWVLWAGICSMTLPDSAPPRSRAPDGQRLRWQFAAIRAVHNDNGEGIFSYQPNSVHDFPSP